MAMIEHAIFSDIPNGKKNGRFHSAVLTTYAIDLIHFDRHMINMLHRKQICSISILADNRQMEKSMEYVGPQFMRNIGKEYSISSMYSKGAFHPKINFFVGDESVLVLFGTGNLTVTGHGKNHEAFTGLYIDETNNLHRPLIEECWRYITQFGNQLSTFDKHRVLHEIPDNCTFLDSNYNIVPHKLCKLQEGLDAALLYNDDTSSILKQITDIVPTQEVQRITVVCPFFDEEGDTLISLTELFPNAKIEVLIDTKCSLPPCKIPENKQICFYSFRETVRGKMNFSFYERLLHAKIFHFKTTEKEYCIIGSANATISGLGTISKRGINDEFGVLYASSETDFLSELGLKNRKKLDKQIKDFSRSKEVNSDDDTHKYKILSANYQNGKLTVTLNQQIPSDTFVIVDYGYNTTKHDTYSFEGNTLSISANQKVDLAICYIVSRKGDTVSNRVFINWIDQLDNTNPSKTSRSLNRFISQIEDEGYKGMEVADMLTDIMWDLANESDDTRIQVKSASSNQERIQKDSLPNISYNKAYDNDFVHTHRSILVDRSSRLIECIEESIRRKIRLIDDAITDEEEQGDAESSNDREISEEKEILIPQKKIKSYAEKSSSVLNKYVELIGKRREQIRKSCFNMITKDDLNFFSLSLFTAIEICYLNRHKYRFGDLDAISLSSCQKQFYESLDRCMNKFGLSAIEEFGKFCKTFGKPKYKDDDFEKKAQRAMKYAILFGALYFKNATEKEKHISKKVLVAINDLSTVLGIPTEKYLEEELMPLSERYDFAFRYKQIHDLINKLS